LNNKEFDVRNNNLMKTVSLYGSINDNKEIWMKWYKSCKDYIEGLGLKANYFSIESATMKTGKVMTMNKSEKKMSKSIEQGDKINWLSIYSLPDNFKQAAFDYDVYMTRGRGHVCFSASKDIYKRIVENDFINLFKQFIEFESGEVFEMAREESSIFYMFRANSAPLQSRSAIN